MKSHSPSTSPRRPHRLARAFTLMEMMLVLAIIAILIGIGVVGMKDATGTADIIATRANLTTIKTALISFKALNGGRLPTQQQGLEALIKPGKYGPAVLNSDFILDRWGHTYKYRNPGKKGAEGYDLYSVGMDGVEGNADDIGNWDDEKK